MGADISLIVLSHLDTPMSSSDSSTQESPRTSYRSSRPRRRFNFSQMEKKTPTAVEQAAAEESLRFDTAVERQPEGTDLTPQRIQHAVNENQQGDAHSDPTKQRGLTNLGTPQELVQKLAGVGYECLPFLAVQIALLLNSPCGRVRALLLEGPSGCGKSFMAKSLAKISGAELMCLSCYKGMPTQNLIESPSTLALKP